ncbi:MAG: hypothetical protein KJO54_07935 [Gammaproteobacteria bacterium]|nr:hypothetical protein [Gammaproteobacteria bacterium]NNF60456.1 hypothetical protein [Gammaproteobacteria bacterium]
MNRICYLAILPLCLSLIACQSKPVDTSQDMTAAAPSQHAEVAERISVTGFSGPESVRYDPELDVYFVGNFNGESSGDSNGFVSKMSPAGEIIELKFMQGGDYAPLHGARGMYADKNGLWVVDALGVHLFDRISGAQLGFVDLSSFDPGFPNDVVRGPDGALYVTDTGQAVVYRIVDGTATVATSTAMRPNGITFNPETGRLLLAPWSDGDALVEWDIADGSFTELPAFSGGSNYDGVEVVDGQIITASQGDTSLHILTDGTDRSAIKLPGKPADIAIDTRRQRVAVPYVSLHQVDIIPLEPYLAP